MNTHLAWEGLNDLLDGRLAEADRLAAEVHLAGCDACRQAADRLRRLLDASAAIPGEVAPPDSLWHSVQATIAARAVHATRPRTPLSAVWRQAAAAVALVVASSSITALVLRTPGETQQAAPAVAAASQTTRLLPAAFVAAERGFVADIAELEALFAEQRGVLSPATVAIVERSLASIDAAIAEARAALLADPVNQQLVELLGASYRQKVDLLRRAAELPHT